MLGMDYRPKTLEEVKGNWKIVNEFKNRSKTYNFPHYMLFQGQSGTGKSTIAFIVAKILNCRNPSKNEEGEIIPCNECKVCKDIDSGQFKRDTVYIDASDMGKDRVKELDRLLGYVPRFDENKIIIIDEAHLLGSKQARGAMLLLSEKPREKVYIILCTTEKDQFDKALQDRYEIYNFPPAKSPDIFENLKKIFLQLNNTKYKDKEFPKEFENEIPNILILISENVEGSFRKALQFLDRVLESELYTVKEVEDELNIISAEEQFTFIHNLLDGKNIDKIFKLLDRIDNEYLYNLTYKYLLKACIWKEIKSSKEISEIASTSSKVSGNYNLAVLSQRNDLDKLLTMIKDIETNQKGFTFNKRYFKLSIIEYLNKLNSVPIMHKKESENKQRTRERVKK